MQGAHIKQIDISINKRTLSRVIFLIAAVQFVNVLDFMMVLPLGPDFAKELGIPLSSLGIIGGSYTMAACIAGLAGFFFLDRFDRRPALIVSLTGLAVATYCGGFSVGFKSLVASRILAGLFGGPATSVALAIVGDLVPIKERGRAMSTVMLSFSMASIFGLPAGLELARIGGWHLPFFAVGTLGLIAVVYAAIALPSVKLHLESAQNAGMPLLPLFKLPKYWFSLLIMSLGILGSFLLVPHFSGYLQNNLGWPREKLGIVYLVGGVLSLFSTRLGGILTDKMGALWSITISTIIIVLILLFGFIWLQPWIPVVVIFPLFMVGNSLRNITLNTLVSKVPALEVRARFNSTLSAIQHAMSATGSMGSSLFLSTSADQKLVGIPLLATITLFLALLIPFMTKKLESLIHD